MISLMTTSPGWAVLGVLVAVDVLVGVALGEGVIVSVAVDVLLGVLVLVGVGVAGPLD
jgi:uncharacterized membrane protein YccC